MEKQPQVSSQDPKLEPEEERLFDTITFKDASGKEMEAVHLSLVEDTNRLLNEYEEVEVMGKSGVAIMDFDEYLARLGITYDQYCEAVKSRSNNSLNEILRDLHLDIITERSRSARELHKRFKVVTQQHETAREHEPFFSRTVNDLGMRGLRAEEASATTDYLDGVDSLITFDHRAFETEGKETSDQPVIVGVQRSFRKKKDEVAVNPIRFIPERAEVGPIFIASLFEDKADYTDGYTGGSLYQKLLSKRTANVKASGRTLKEYAARTGNQGFPRIDTVIPGGKPEQAKRVIRLLTEIKNQLSDYIDSSNFKQQTIDVQRALKKQYDEMDIDDFLNTANTISKMAA